uniref:NADH dehydrogenase subunit 6 n=1 Tax=Deleatidium vernale TaxID=1968931 RepID=UPI0028D8EEE6|nr:NADH dehydrogenase subunit 6 [Deleatidium vernale]WMQ76564.1 NADH dehydrogenase subunit 6 [Deleatidium vernale]
MLTIILVTNLLFIGAHFMSMMHPLAMGLILLIQSLGVALLTGVIAPTFWFSYILFLVFLGGLMVLFIYVTSLASNEMFSLSSLSLLTVAPMLAILLLSMLTVDSWAVNLIPTTLEFTSLTPLSDYLVKLYSYPTSLMTSFLIVYLLLTLIAVVTITKFLNGPLRVSN